MNKPIITYHKLQKHYVKRTNKDALIGAYEYSDGYSAWLEDIIMRIVNDLDDNNFEDAKLIISKHLPVEEPTNE